MRKTGIIKLNKDRFLWDVSFVLWMVTDYVFSHSVLSILSFAFFVGMTFLAMFNRVIRFPRMGGMLIWYSLFTLFACLNIVTGHSINRAASESLISTLLLNMVFFCSFFHYLRHAGADRFKRILVFSAVAASILMLLLNFAATHTFIIRGGAMNGNSLAVCNAIVICWILCDGKFRARAWRNTFTVVFLLAFCLLAGTRKAVFVLAIGVALFVLLNNPMKLVRNILFLLVTVLAGYMCITEIPLLHNLIGYRMDTLFALISGSKGGASERARMAFIRLGLRYFRQNMFWGHGINCFKLIPGSANTYSHNNYVELLFSTGIPGTLLYYGMYLVILRNGIRWLLVGKTRTIVLGICLTVVILFTDVAMVSYYSRETFMYLALLYYLVTDNSQNIKGAYTA